jgi:serine/threonine protein kinase
MAAKYEIGDAIGGGEFSTVYLARSKETGVKVAVKVLQVMAAWLPWARELLTARPSSGRICSC